MARGSKRAKTTRTSRATSGNAKPPSASTHRSLLFQTGPSLEHIPDDIFHEILSYLPTLTNRHILFGHLLTPAVVPSAELVRTPTLRALSQTSRLLRLRCLAMAWQSIEFCAASVPKHNTTFYKVVAEATMTGTDILEACPHLLPLIQTVSFVLTRYRSNEVISGLATCLATLPNLTTIQVIRVHSEMATDIKYRFLGKRFPSVRRISLPSTAHEIIKSCPNLEEVTCTDGGGSQIIRSLIHGGCRQVHALKGFCLSLSAPLTRKFVNLLPNLKYMSVSHSTHHFDTSLLASFPLIETIEIAVHDNRGDVSLSEHAASSITKASKILQENKSQAVKTVIVKRQDSTWNHRRCAINVDEVYMATEVIRV